MKASEVASAPGMSSGGKFSALFKHLLVGICRKSEHTGGGKNGDYGTAGE